MLLNDFFEITGSQNTDGKIDATIQLNAKHRIFSGHFPGNPVTPGVVQIQIVKEILEDFYHRELKMISMSQCKFLKILNPLETNAINITIQVSHHENLIKVNASGADGESIFLKMNATYQQ